MNRLQSNDPQAILDQYSIFDLMGLKNVSPERKGQMLADLNALVWAKFAAERLPGLLTHEQFSAVQITLKDDKSLEEVVAQITDAAPNFPDLLAEYTNQFKETYIEEYWADRVRSLDQLLANKDLNADNQNKLKIDREKCVRALELARTDEWEKLDDLWNHADNDQAITDS